MKRMRDEISRGGARYILLLAMTIEDFLKKEQTDVVKAQIRMLKWCGVQFMRFRQEDDEREVVDENNKREVVDG